MNITTITPNETCEQITIEGCSNQEEALTAAIEWCDEHNCLLIDITPQDQQYVATITSDDYH